MTKSTRALLAAVALGVAALLLWAAIPPSTRGAPSDHDHIVDEAAFDVDMSRFVVLLRGPAEVHGNGAYFATDVYRVAGEGGRAWPERLTVTDGDGRIVASGGVASATREGARARLVLDVPLDTGVQALTFDLRLHAARESTWRTVAEAPVEVRFDKVMVDVRPAESVSS